MFGDSAFHVLAFKSPIERIMQIEFVQEHDLQREKNCFEILDNEEFSINTKVWLEHHDSAIARSVLWECYNDNKETFKHIVSSLNLCTELINYYIDIVNLNQKNARLIFNAVATHDWGKVHIRNEIISKQSGLDDDELGVMREHPLFSAEELLNRGQRQLAAIVVRHHMYDLRHAYPEQVDIEKLFGKYMLKEDFDELFRDPWLDLFAKVVSIIDRVEAMLTDKRSYKGGMWREQVKDILYQDYPKHHNFIDFAIEKWHE